MDTALTVFDLQARYQVYRFFAEHGRAPAYLEIAALLGAEPEAARLAFHKLHARHMLYLEPGTDDIRIANPFSAAPTRFRVTAGGRAWWANCAWDMLGVAAALNLDVDIAAQYPDEPGVIPLRVQGGAVDGGGRLVYFPLPFRQWYDDLVFT
jgi:hypothetical protein